MCYTFIFVNITIHKIYSPVTFEIIQTQNCIETDFFLSRTITKWASRPYVDLPNEDICILVEIAVVTVFEILSLSNQTN